MAEVLVPGRPCMFGTTQRKDAWWTEPLVMAIALIAFIAYSSFRAVYNADYQIGVGTAMLPEHAYLLSPFYSPLLLFPWLPAWLSPSFFILWAPAGFRFTCYYFRRVYYRALFLDPAGCAVEEGRGEPYHGETRFLLMQNLHRYFLGLALLLIVFHAVDLVHAFLWPVGPVAAGSAHHGAMRFGVSVGSLVLLTDTILLSLYVFSCHSFRHFVGGRLDCFSCPTGKVRYGTWRGVSALNEYHHVFGWSSLFMVGFADFYVWMVASGRITDLRII